MANHLKRLRLLVFEGRLYWMALDDTCDDCRETSTAKSVADVKRVMREELRISSRVHDFDIYLEDILVGERQTARLIRDKDFLELRFPPLAGHTAPKQWTQRSTYMASKDKTMAMKVVKSSAAKISPAKVSSVKALTARRSPHKTSKSSPVKPLKAKRSLTKKGTAVEASKSKVSTDDTTTAIADDSEAVERQLLEKEFAADEQILNESIVTLTNALETMSDDISPKEQRHLLEQQIEDNRVLNESIQSLNKAFTTIARTSTSEANKSFANRRLQELKDKIHKINECLDKSLAYKLMITGTTTTTTTTTTTRPIEQTSSAKQPDGEASTDTNETTGAAAEVEAPKPPKMIRLYQPSPRLRGQWVCCLCDELLPHWKAIQSHHKPYRCEGYECAMAAMEVPDNAILVAERLDWWEP